MHHLADGYFRFLAVQNYSPKSIASRKHSLNRFFSFLIAQRIKRVQDVNLDHLRQYRLMLCQKGYANESIRGYIVTVRGFFGYLKRGGHLFDNPAQALLIPKRRVKIQPVPSFEDVLTLLNSPDTNTPMGIRDRAILETAYGSGIRRQELCKLAIHDIDFKAKTLKIEGKGSKQRLVPLGRHAAYWIKTYMDHVRVKWAAAHEPFLFISYKTKTGLSPDRIGQITKTYTKAAGIQVSTHGLRRACVTHMLANGAHPEQIRLILGHSGFASLRHYLDVAIHDLLTMHKKSKPGQ